MQCSWCGLSEKGFSNRPVVVVRDGKVHTYCSVEHAKEHEKDLDLQRLRMSGPIQPIEIPKPTPEVGGLQQEIGSLKAEAKKAVAQEGEVEPSIQVKLGIVDEFQRITKENMAQSRDVVEKLRRDIRFWNEVIASYERGIEHDTQTLSEIADIRVKVVSGEL